MNIEDCVGRNIDQQRRLQLLFVRFLHFVYWAEAWTRSNPDASMLVIALQWKDTA